MKFVKGIMWGTVISTGMIMMYSEMSNSSKNKMMKKGKKAIKKMGII